MPLPPELSRIDIISKSTEPDQIAEGKVLARSWFDYARSITESASPDPIEAGLALDALEKVKVQITGLSSYGNDMSATDIGQRFKNLSETYKAKLERIVEASVAAAAPVSRIDMAPERAELTTLFSTVQEQEILREILFPTTPLELELYSVLKKLKSQIDRVAVIPRTDARAKNIVSIAQKTVVDVFAYADRSRDVSSDWRLLIDEMDAKNVNPDDHTSYESPNADRRLVDLYTWFTQKKSPRVGESSRDQLERLEAVVGWKVTRAESQNQNEGQMPSCTRADLFPVMAQRSIERNELLAYATYHPEYGNEVKKMLKHLVWLIAQNPNSSMKYDVLVSSNGRAIMKDYAERVFKPQLLSGHPAPPTALEGVDPSRVGSHRFHEVNQIYAAVPDPRDKEKRVQEVIDLTLRLFYFFDLLTVSFAELQKQTKTRSHDKQKGGNPVTDKDRVLLSRPDAAVVHRLQRYDTEADWSAWWLVLQEEIPVDYGRNGDPVKREELKEIQHKLKLYLEAYFDTDKFTGVNGIPPSKLFEPLFPDMLSYLNLASTEILVIGDDCVIDVDGKSEVVGKIGRSPVRFVRELTDRKMLTAGGTLPIESTLQPRANYLVAEDGWEKFIELTLGGLPSVIKEVDILEHAPGFPTGLMDAMINGAAGLAKTFPGDHMKKAMVPLFTQYIGRIFMRFADTGVSRQTVYEKVVEKLENSKGGGLKGFESQVDKIIARISDGHGLSRMGEMLELNRRNRQEKRAEYLDLIWHERRWAKPPSTTPGFSNIATGVQSNPLRKAQMDEYLKIMNGQATLPPPGVTRKGDLMRKPDSK